jgi:hypothetical protein
MSQIALTLVDSLESHCLTDSTESTDSINVNWLVDQFLSRALRE